MNAAMSGVRRGAHGAALLGFRELVEAFERLEIRHDSPVIAHASLSSFGQVNGGACTLLRALLHQYKTLVMPGFTYKTMLVPLVGPADNGITYGRHNPMVEFYNPDMPVDPMIGALAEALRTHPDAERSNHPILSFVGVNARPYLDKQSIQDPLSPIAELHRAEGWVLLLGVGHTTNTSLHYAERLAGRKGFLRWSLTPEGVLECPGFPGCSYGFDAIAARLVGVTRSMQAGQAQIQAIPLVDLVSIAKAWIESNPVAMLCALQDCGRCQAVRDGLCAD